MEWVRRKRHTSRKPMPTICPHLLLVLRLTVASGSSGGSAAVWGKYEDLREHGLQPLACTWQQRWQGRSGQGPCCMRGRGVLPTPSLSMCKEERPRCPRSWTDRSTNMFIFWIAQVPFDVASQLPLCIVVQCRAHGLLLLGPPIPVPFHKLSGVHQPLGRPPSVTVRLPVSHWRCIVSCCGVLSLGPQRLCLLGAPHANCRLTRLVAASCIHCCCMEV